MSAEVVDIDSPEVFGGAAHAAFHKSETYSFNGEELDFSWDRWQAAQFIGLALDNLTGENRKRLEEAGGDDGDVYFYAGMDADATLTVYLSRCPEAEVYKAYRKPDEIRRKASRWGKEIGLRRGAPIYAELVDTFAEFLNDIYASEAASEDGGAASEDSLGESGSPQPQQGM